jgi:hypothetical protein
MNHYEYKQLEETDWKSGLIKIRKNGEKLVLDFRE